MPEREYENVTFKMEIVIKIYFYKHNKSFWIYFFHDNINPKKVKLVINL